jgi:peptidoglycan-N-acetylglucosamine deacetylase
MLRFYRTPDWLSAMFPRFVWHQSRSEKKIYLTFDDGPIPDITEWVLETLAAKGAKATFFCVGDNIRKHPQVFERIVAGGHQVGNHTFNHLKGWKTPNDIYWKNIQDCDEIIVRHHAHSNLFRPPYGRITSAQVQKLRNEYQIILWDVLTNDYDASLSTEKCLRKAIQSTKNGSIVVFHDSLKASKNLQFVLTRYLDHFAELGFSFERLDID